MIACQRCGAPVNNGQLVCPTCGGLAYQRQLEQLANEALQQEQTNPAAAAAIWRQTLDLVPAQAPQYQQVQQRVGLLTGTWNPPQATPVQTMQYAQAVRPPDPLPLAIAKTAGSMFFSAIVYYFFLFQNAVIAVGFVVLMLVHEMGHVFAMRYYGLSASPPIFIPFVGALINMRQRPPNALVESVVGMGGPLLGTIGALACYFAAESVADPALHKELLIVALLAFMLNLFNLLPVPPLDGGRITAAVSPWLWIPGLAGLGYLIFVEIREGGGVGVFILVLILFYAFPRIRTTLQARGRKVPYYQISKTASWTMGVLYVGLGAVLVYMFYFRLHGIRFLRGG